MSGLFWGVQLFCDNHIEPYCDFWFYFDKSYIFITNPLLFCYKHDLWILWLVVAMFSKFSERCSDYSRGHICHYSVVTFQWNCVKSAFSWSVWQIHPLGHERNLCGELFLALTWRLFHMNNDYNSPTKMWPHLNNLD